VGLGVVRTLVRAPGPTQPLTPAHVRAGASPHAIHYSCATGGWLWYHVVMMTEARRFYLKGQSARLGYCLTVMEEVETMLNNGVKDVLNNSDPDSASAFVDRRRQATVLKDQLQRRLDELARELEHGS